MKRISGLVLSGFLLVAAYTATYAQQLPPGIQKVTSVEGITEYRLANGLRVLLFPDPSKPTITVNVTVLVGSGSEGYGEKGMAHLLEHLVFKGTPRHPDIPKELTEHGTRPNGTTSFDRTNYFETFQATEENLKWALDMEADRLVNSFIAKKDLDSEMTVVRNEWEAGENFPQSVLQKRILAAAYEWHNYGHTVIGARSDIEKVPIERLQEFYRKHYQTDNAILMVAGKIDESTTLRLINETFGKISAPSRKLETNYTQEPVQDGERLVTLRRVGDVQMVMAGYHIPAGSHPDFAAVDVLTNILSDRPAGRLHKGLVETKKAASVFGFPYQLKDPGIVLLGAEVRKDQSLDAARDEMLKTIDELGAKPPTKEEVERAKQALLKNIELNLNNSEFVGLTISNWAAQGDWRLLFLHRDRLRKVTPEDALRVATAYLKPSNRTVGLYLPVDKLPERAEVPPPPNVTEMLKDYKGDAEVAVGEAFDPSPANIESRVRRLDLPNGLKVALLSKKTRGAAVVGSITLRYGDETSLKGRAREASLAASMLMRGTTKHTRQQIRDELDKLKARVNVFGGATQVGASLETVRGNLPAVLKLVAEVLREPSFPESEFEQLRQEQLAQIEQFRREPQAIAFTNLERHLRPYPKGDPRYTATPEEQIEEIRAMTLDQLKRFYNDFYGASNGQLVIVGDFDDQEISALVTELLGTWKSPRPFKRVPSKHFDVAVTDQSFDAPDKTNATMAAGMNLKLRDDHPDYPALLLGNYILGSGMNSRLFQRIRQKEGLSYGVGTQFGASPLDEFGSFQAMAIFAPQNAAKVEAAFKDELSKMFKDGFTADELKIAKSGWSQQQQLNRAGDQSLASRLANYLFIDRKLDWDAKLEANVNQLTPEQINAAMRKHLDQARISIIKAGDFKKSPGLN
jgi:zinc protease